jgi:hypothetical protein
MVLVVLALSVAAFNIFKRCQQQGLKFLTTVANRAKKTFLENFFSVGNSTYNSVAHSI